MTTPEFKGTGVVVIPPVALFFFLVTGVSAWMAYGGTIALPWFIRWFPGISIIATGLLFARAGFVAFRRADTTVRQDKETAKLVTTGVYRFSRNPMYLGMVMVLVGLGTGLGAIPVFVAALGMFLYLDRYVIPREEAALARTFGRDYEKLRKRVRRWV